MTKAPGPESDELETRLADAMRVLAETQVPDAVEGEKVARRSATRPLALVAAVLLLAVGGVGLFRLVDRTEPTGVSDGPASDVPMTTEAPRVDSSVDASDAANASPSEQEADVDVGPRTTAQVGALPDGEMEAIAILDPDPGRGEISSAAERWVFGGPELQHYAVRTNADGSSTVLSWTILPDSEWGKSFADQPDVELPDGRVAKRLVPTLVDSVNYAIRTDDGLFSAAISPDAEDELGDWFAEVAGQPSSEIDPPEAFTVVPDQLDARSVYYGSNIGIDTAVYFGDIDIDTFLVTRMPGYTAEPSAARDDVLVAIPPESRRDVLNALVVWQPTPDTIVTAHGPAGELESIAASLTMTDLASADLDVRDQLLRSSGVSDVEILGDTAEGRFVYTNRTNEGGQVCTSFVHDAYGGGGGCDESEVAGSGVNCGSGWSAPDEAFAFVFVPSATVPSVEFTIDGRPLDPTIESGTTDGVDWVFVSVREAGHPDSNTLVLVSVDGHHC
ncbi:hypothetical protein [Ilumatobacter sp.]|uniref:hypothetical protein n=1 Tax=Ilumatobacter sp. TaxID=1967498 RepID=UPI003C66C6D3